MTTIRNGFTLAVAEAEITRRLSAGERVLIVGARPSNLPAVLQTHPQVEHWESTATFPTSVPARARIVLFTKWVGHTDHKTIRADAGRDETRFIWPALLGTGQIRRLLKPLIDNPPPPAPAPEPAVETVEPMSAPCDCGYVPHCGIAWGGSTREFVEVHWHRDEEHTAGWQTREAKRLHRLSAQHGLSTTLNYVQILISQLNTEHGKRERDEAQLSAERAARAAEALAHAEAQHWEEIKQDHAAKLARVEAREAAEAATPPPAPKPKSTEAVQAGEQRVDAELGELLRMIDDATAVLALARETIVQLSRDNAEQRAVRDRLRARVRAALEEAI